MGDVGAGSSCAGNTTIMSSTMAMGLIVAGCNFVAARTSHGAARFQEAPDDGLIDGIQG